MKGNSPKLSNIRDTSLNSAEVEFAPFEQWRHSCIGGDRRFAGHKLGLNSTGIGTYPTKMGRIAAPKYLGMQNIFTSLRLPILPPFHELDLC